MKRLTQRNQRGNGLVEAALALLVFMSMLLCVFDFAQVLYLHQSITERVREALRYGIVNSYDATAIQNYVLYGQPTQPAGASPYFSLTSNMVSVQRVDAGTSEDRIVITVSNFPYVFLSPYIAGNKTGAAITEALPYEYQ